VSVNDADPPLPHSDGAFDLVFNHSVFTHIDERRQDLWLSDVQRVVRPGGLLVLTVHGEAALPDSFVALRDRLERDGIAYVDNSFPKEHRLPDWYQNTWHAPWYVFEHWGRWFEVRGYVPGGGLAYQDHVLLERKAGAPRPPLAVGPGLAVQGRPSERVARALGEARHHRATSAAGRLRGFTRGAVLRAIRPYTVHEDRVDAAVEASIDELTRAVDEHVRLLRRLEDRREEDG
jgi:SAM-dependent methyltransferase